MMIDVVATTLIANPSTAVASGFTALYLVTVAAASTLLRRRQLSTLVAAITSLAILADSTWDPEPPLPRDRYGPVCAR